MKETDTTFDDAELDRLLESQPVTVSAGFTDKVLKALKQDNDELLDEWLNDKPIELNNEFTRHTLQRIHEEHTEAPVHHMSRWWMGIGSVAAGLVAAWLWMIQPDALLPSSQDQQINIGEMQIEELFFVEENLSSATVLIDLDENLPLLALIAESGT